MKPNHLQQDLFKEEVDDTLPFEFKNCDNCGKSEQEQALSNHLDENWCWDCMRLAGHCLSCDKDIREVVEDYYNYDYDCCPDCEGITKKIINK